MRAARVIQHLADWTEDLAEKRVGAGILMLDGSLQLLYRNRRSGQLCDEINKLQEGKAANGVLPPAVAELCAGIKKNLQVRIQAKDRAQFTVRRIAGNRERPVLLCGLGLPDLQGLQQSRILVMMESIDRRQDTTTAGAKQLYGLTDREAEVVSNLLKGWTNKEIANELAVTEQTVKEHIKHIMEKTKTSTRTGILMQVVQKRESDGAHAAGQPNPPPTTSLPRRRLRGITRFIPLEKVIGS